MRPLRYSINVSLDGCIDHLAMVPNEQTYRHVIANFERSDAMLLGRVTYEMMEVGWRQPATESARPEWVESFGRVIDAIPKHVVSSTLDHVDWNATLVRGDLATAVNALKQQSGKGVLLGGVTLPLALADLGLIDEYEFMVHPRVVGHGPRLLDGLSRYLDLELVEQIDLGSGIFVVRYVPRR